MKVIHNLVEFKANLQQGEFEEIEIVKAIPSFPVILWTELEDFGLVGDGLISYWQEVPPDLDKQSYIQGFKDGANI